MSTLPKPNDWQQPQLFYGKPLEFNPASHRYKWNGEWVPSVTTILGRMGKGDALVQWAASCAVEHIRCYARSNPNRTVSEAEWDDALKAAGKAWCAKRDAAADIGTRVHEYARGMLAGKSPSEPLDGPAQKAVEAFWQWVEQHKIVPIHLERRVMSKRHMYAGTTDFYGLIDDRLAVLDFKTGRGVYDEAWWQTTAYVEALDEELQLAEVPVRWVVHLDKETGECTAYSRDSLNDHEQDRRVWVSLLMLDKALRTARPHPRVKKAA